MSNTRLLFCGSNKSETIETYLECYANESGEIYINVESKDGQYNYICLDKNTAIKLSKELKKQINLIE